MRAFRQRKVLTVVIAAVVLFSSRFLEAELYVTTGGEDGFWGRHMLVAARIEMVSKVKDPKLGSELSIDATGQSVMGLGLENGKLKFSLNIASATIRVPKFNVGETYLVCLEMLPDQTWSLSNWCTYTFLPQHQVILVSGPEDPLVSVVTADAQLSMNGAGRGMPKSGATRPANSWAGQESRQTGIAEESPTSKPSSNPSHGQRALEITTLTGWFLDIAPDGSATFGNSAYTGQIIAVKSPAGTFAVDEVWARLWAHSTVSAQRNGTPVSFVTFDTLDRNTGERNCRLSYDSDAIASLFQQVSDSKKWKGVDAIELSKVWAERPPSPTPPRSR